MRILIYGLNFSPEVVGIGRYTGELAAWLTERGHEVTCITAPPYYPEWRVRQPYSGWRYVKERHRGVEVWRCPIWVPGHVNGVMRILHLLSFALSSLPVVLTSSLRRSVDVVLVVEPTTLILPMALTAAKLSGAKSWLHVQDIELGAIARVSRLGLPIVTRLLSMAYSRLLRLPTAVTTLSDRMRQELAQLGRPLDQIGLFRNWVDVRKIFPTSAAALRGELGISSDEIVALYSGNMGVKQGIETLIEVAQHLADEPGLRLVLCGDGALRSRVEAAAKELRNVLLLPLQPEERLNELLSLADIHLLPQRAGTTHFAMPSKLGGMLASGRPIVAQADAACEVRALVEGCGLVVEPGNTLAMVEAIGRLARDHDLRRRFGAAGRSRAEACLSREQVLASAAAILDTLAPSTAEVALPQEGRLV